VHCAPLVKSVKVPLKLYLSLAPVGKPTSAQSIAHKLHVLETTKKTMLETPNVKRSTTGISPQVYPLESIWLSALLEATHSIATPYVNNVQKVLTVRFGTLQRLAYPVITPRRDYLQTTMLNLDKRR
jgi:hypothetical protein